MLCIPVATVVLCSSISSCSSGTNGNGTSNTSSSAASTAPLLQLQDLPAGFVLAATSTATPSPPNVSPASCKAVVDPAGGLLDHATDRGEARFADGSDGPFVDEQVGRFPTSGAAVDAVKRFRDSAAACPSWTQNGARFTTSLMSFPALTSQTAATRADGPGLDAYLVVAEQGLWVVTVTVAASTTPPLADTESIARAAVRHLPAA
jgi:hypothetical protein